MIPGVPYDAEIEYLQSSGTQWIDTGVAFTSSDIVNCDFMLTNGTYSAIFGAGNADGAAGASYSIYLQNRATLQFQCTSAPGATASYAINARYAFVGNISSRTMLLNGGAAISAGNTPLISMAQSVYIFCRNLNGVADRKCRMRLYAFSIVGRCDFIPVRVGQVGYLYDRVTRRLFGNMGTGSFVLGPDVAKPVMGLWGMKQITYVPSDYVTDGIVAWYDGEWNAGWGKYDSSAATWKDLSGNNLDLTVDLTYGTWNQNRLTPKGGGVPAYKADGQTALNSLGVVPKAAEVVFYNPYQNDFRTIINISYVGNRYNCVAGYYNTVGWGGALRNATKGITMACSTSLSYSYINGVSAGNTVYTNNITSAGRSASELSICGVRQNLQGGISYPFNGSVYCVRVYSRALSPAEIAHNYQIDKARFNLP